MPFWDVLCKLGKCRRRFADSGGGISGGYLEGFGYSSSRFERFFGAFLMEVKMGFGGLQWSS